MPPEHLSLHGGEQASENTSRGYSQKSQAEIRGTIIVLRPLRPQKDCKAHQPTREDTGALTELPGLEWFQSYLQSSKAGYGVTAGNICQSDCGRSIDM